VIHIGDNRLARTGTENLEMNRSYQGPRLRRIANGQWQIADGTVTGGSVGHLSFQIVNSAAAAPSLSDSSEEKWKRSRQRNSNYDSTCSNMSPLKTFRTKP
jgi:hypothetical protein